MGVEIQLFEVGAYKSDFSLCGWMKSDVYKENVNIKEELVACIMNSAALLKQECQDYNMRATRTIAKELKGALNSMVGFFNTYLNCCSSLRLFT